MISILQQDIEVLKKQIGDLTGEKQKLEEKIACSNQTYASVLASKIRPTSVKSPQERPTFAMPNRFEVLRDISEEINNQPEIENVRSQSETNGKKVAKRQSKAFKEAKNRPKTQCEDGKVLVCGDSMIKHVKVKNASEVKVFRGIRAEQLSRKLESEIRDSAHMKTVVLHVGTNDIKRSTSPDDVMGEVYDLIRSVKKKCPTACVVVNSIVRRRDVSALYIDNINSSLRWACSVLGAVYNDVTRYLDASCLARDGLHLNRKGSHILGKVIEHVIDICEKFQGN